MTIAGPFYPQIRPAFAVKTTMVPSPIAGCLNNISSTRYLPDDHQPSPISPDIFRTVFCLLQFFANDLLEIFPIDVLHPLRELGSEKMGSGEK